MEQMKGGASCLLARSFLTYCMRSDRELSKFNTTIWERAFTSSGPENPSMRGFVAEQLLLAEITEHGLGAMGNNWDGQIKPETFLSDIPILPIGDKPVNILFIPSKYNYKAVDGILYMTQNDPENQNKMVATIIPLQITIAKKHTDSEAKFFTAWDFYEEQLAQMGNISRWHAIFLWIYETIQAIPMDKRRAETVGKHERTARGRTVLIHPAYERRLMAVGAASKRIGERLEDAQRTARANSKGKSRATTTTINTADCDDGLGQLHEGEVQVAQEKAKANTASSGNPSNSLSPPLPDPSPPLPDASAPPPDPPKGGLVVGKARVPL